MDRGRQQELINALIKLNPRAAGQGDDTVRLSSRYGIAKANFDNLHQHERRWLRAIAVGKTMHKAALAGRSAARTHGMWVIGPEQEPVEVIPVGSKVPSKKQWPPGIVYLEPRVRSANIERFATLRATDPLSTAFEIALRHGFREGLIAMDWVLKHQTTREEVEAEMRKLGSVRGIGTLRRVVEYAVPNSMSAYESYARAILIEAGIDGWEVNAQVGPYKVDLLRDRVGVEVDGGVKYDGQTYQPLEQTLMEERVREKHIQNRGIFLHRVHPKELLFEEERFVREVRELIEAAEVLDPQHGAG